MKILVINSGSSSIKYQLFQMPERQVIAKGLLERIGEAESFFCQKSDKGSLELKKAVPDHEQGVKFILSMLTDPERGVIGSADEIGGVGHRVVHGGEEFTSSVHVTREVIARIKEFADLAPLHNPPNLMGIEACTKALPKAVEVATFDTAFHQTIPPDAYLYAIPRELYAKYRIRRYGFHGTSHRYVSRRCAEIMGRDPKDLNIITCHLGNGCSICAVKQGLSVDTSMGFTPLEGLVMGTRCGDLDPAIVFYLVEKGYSPQEVSTTLNKKSGLLGISGISNDMRNLSEAREKGDEKAALAIDIFCYRLKKYIGAYLAVLGRTDAVVFTGGIGENNAYSRGECLRGMESLGIRVDAGKNRAARGETLISDGGSAVRVYVIPTNEELQIACDTFDIAERMRCSQ